VNVDPLYPSHNYPPMRFRIGLCSAMCSFLLRPRRCRSAGFSRSDRDGVADLRVGLACIHPPMHSSIYPTPLVPALLACVLLASAGCVYHSVRMQTRSLPERNPTVYQFEVPLEELRAQVIAGLTWSNQYKNPIFEAPKGRSKAVFHVEAGDVKSWPQILLLPGNSRDLYLHTSDPVGESAIYRGPNNGLPFLAGFHVHFAAISPTQTSVSVTALETRVLNGEMTGMPGHGRARREVRVQPTSIEEYVVLRHIGNILGVRSMPKVILPAGDVVRPATKSTQDKI
jgi:hypothetical protein